MRPDIVASYKITVAELDRFDPAYLVDDAKMIRGVRDAAIIDLVEPNSFVLDVRFHGQTEQSTAEGIANRILAILDRDTNLPTVEYGGLLGHEEPVAGIEWTGRDPWDEVTSEHDGQKWVRADYFVHALSFEDLGIRDVNYEHMIIESLQRWPQRLPAREAVRRLREMYALLEDVRRFAGMPIEEHEEVVVLGEAVGDTAVSVREEPVAVAGTPAE